MLSGVFRSSQTVINFSSCSALKYICIEMSQEMFSFDENGFLFSEKAVHFLQAYFERSKVSAPYQEVTLIMFGRLFYPQIQSLEQVGHEMEKAMGKLGLGRGEIEQNSACNSQGRGEIYQDFFVKVGQVDLGKDGNCTPLLNKLKKHLNFFPSLINWEFNLPGPHVSELKKFYHRSHFNEKDSFLAKNISTKLLQDLENPFLENQNEASNMMPCELSTSEKSNLLEMINISCSDLLNEEVDLNLKATGIHLLVLTAG